MEKGSLIILASGMVLGGSLVHLLSQPPAVPSQTIYNETDNESTSTVTDNEQPANLGVNPTDTNLLLTEKVKKLESELERLRLENQVVAPQPEREAGEIDEVRQTQRIDLETRIRQLEGENQRLENRLRAFEPSEISDEQMRALIEAPFNDFLTLFKGQNRDEIHDFYQREDDPNWGFEMEQNISDFISTHYKAPFVTIAGLSCKVDACEVRLVESDHENNHMQPLLKEMHRQPWYKFRHSQTSSSSDDQNGVINLFMFLKT